MSLSYKLYEINKGLLVDTPLVWHSHTANHVAGALGILPKCSWRLPWHVRQRTDGALLHTRRMHEFWTMCGVCFKLQRQPDSIECASSYSSFLSSKSSWSIQSEPFVHLIPHLLLYPFPFLPLCLHAFYT